MARPENEALLRVVDCACKALGIHEAPSMILVHRGREIIAVDISSRKPFDLPWHPAERAGRLISAVTEASKAGHNVLFFGLRETGGDLREEWFLADDSGHPCLIDGSDVKAGFNRIA